jgi:membrane protein implicated in regulation of membrane protease activity
VKNIAKTVLTCILSLCLASPAFAYVGPGAGLSLLGALWGLLAAVVAALAFVILWPLKRMLKGRREKATSADAHAREEARDIPVQGTLATDTDEVRATRTKHPAQQA